MPLYDFKCKICKNIRQVRVPISEDPYVECCGVGMSQVFLKSPAGSIDPRHQAVKDKLGYYGIKNAVTGEGITKNTDVTEGLGVNIGTDTKDIP